MVRVSSPAKFRPWSELTAKMVMGVVPRVGGSEVEIAFEAPSVEKHPLAKLDARSRFWGFALTAVTML